MAEVVIPEIKHEYIRQVDTETTKDDWFDECIADNKEAAWAGIGTGELDSQYQPSPVKEPDYYMQYCSSDDYDYLKDYRLIWGYGIGIIEQDVICSLSTGEHLAEGKDACDTYATENTAGENVDWKRGIWLKFSGNRNVSPARIGAVVLPDYIISLKDLCVVLTSSRVNVESFNTNNIINMDCMFGTINNSNRLYNVQSNFKFDNALSINYAFKYCHFVDFPYDINNRNLGGVELFYYCTVDNEVSEVNMKLYKSMFCSSNIIINENFVFDDAADDISYAFNRADIKQFPKINFTDVINTTGLFLNINIIDENESKLLNLENLVYNETNENVFLSTDKHIDLHIISPINEVRNFGESLFQFSDSKITFDTTFQYNKITSEQIFNSNWYNNSDKATIFSMRCNNIICNGTINGTLIGRYNYNNNKLFNDNSNIKIIQDDLTYDELRYIAALTNKTGNVFPFFMLYRNSSTENINITFNENILDFSESQIIGNLFYEYNNKNFNINNELIDITIDINKPILISGNYFNKININNTTNNIIIGNSFYNVKINKDDCILNNNTNNNILCYNGYNYWINTNTNIDLFSKEIKVIKVNNINTNFNSKLTNYNANIIYKIYDCNTLIINGDERFYGTIYIPKDFKLNIDLNGTNNYGQITFININEENDTIRFPNLLKTTNDYYFEYYGRFEDFPLSLFFGRHDVSLSNPYKCVYINDIETKDINIKELVYVNKTINIDISMFNIIVNYTNLVTSNNSYIIYNGIMLDGTESNIKINNITFESYKHSAMNSAFLYLYHIESDNLNINFYFDKNIVLYISDNPKLTSIEFSNIQGHIYAMSDYTHYITNFIIKDNCKLSTNNLSYLDKLTQESINSIVNPINYKSGCTLTINTIPFQYITEEQKQALVNAGVTLVEYIPTETTE